MIQDESAEFLYLIEPLKLEDPRLHQALQRLIGQVSAVTLEVSPIVVPPPLPEPPPVELAAPLNPVALIMPTSIRLMWNMVPGAAQYEVRFMNQATFDAQDWNVSTFVVRSTSTVVDVVPFKGPLGYYAFKSIGEDGSYSNAFSTVTVRVNMPKQVTINGHVIDNNVLLTWTKMGDWVPDSGYLQVDKYEIYRDGLKIGETKASFVSSFETGAGTFTYSIIAVDIGGNHGPSASITLQVATPPDYVLEAEKFAELNGESINVVIYSGEKLLGPVFVPAQTWEQHFQARTWQDPEDQTTAGYPIYIQPGPPIIPTPGGSIPFPPNARGFYAEFFDYGTVITNAVITFKFNFRQIDPNNPVTLDVILANSMDGDTFIQSYGATQFVESARYFYFQLIFSGGDIGLAEVFNVSITINVKRDIDGGAVNALASDAAGTLVNFNKTFQDIESITVTPRSQTEPLMAIFDFVDVPNPTFFKVFVFDTTGMRFDAVVDWKARGVVI